MDSDIIKQLHKVFTKGTYLFLASTALQLKIGKTALVTAISGN